MNFCPERVRNWSSSRQNESELSLSSIQCSFPLLQGPSCRKSPPALFRPTGSKNVILRRGRPISNLFGAKAHANVLKGTFSTGCKIQLHNNWPKNEKRPALRFSYCHGEQPCQFLVSKLEKNHGTKFRSIPLSGKKTGKSGNLGQNVLRQ